MITARREGIKEGENIKAIAIAKNALEMGLPITNIVRLTGLTEAEIKAL
jgi:predicted transposase YdaD